MRLERLFVENFRCYGSELSARFGGLTAFIGKNDIGKSTLLEALEIFFNSEIVKADVTDKNIFSDGASFSITCDFSGFPPTLSLDAGAETDLATEYLLSAQGTLRIRKVFDCKSKKLVPEVYIVANHPTTQGVHNLLELKEKELQALVKENELKVPLKGNPGMRKALWDATPALNLKETDLPISKAKEDAKRIWDAIEKHLPLYALFQSDRKSQDSDGEVQNPMKAAITAALAEVQEEVEAIQTRVREKAIEIANDTHAALMTLDSNLAKELVPEFTPPTPAKWNSLFSINMATDGIPLNKRGSGVRRLVLVSFFKAEAERKLNNSSRRSIIYAIEEPETSQHPNNQRLLIDSLKDLSDEPTCQVVITTHSPGLAAELSAEDIRFVARDTDNTLCIREGAPIFGIVAETLGVTPDSRVRALLCVEGPNDVLAFRALSRALHQADADIPDLSNDERIAFVVLGGSTLNQWVTENYLRALRKPELHIYDRDVPSYEIAVAEVNGRGDGSHAFRTAKHEIECYLHPDAIRDAFGVIVPVYDHPASSADSVAKQFAAIYSASRGFDGVMRESTAKRYLAERAFNNMTAAWIDERDPTGEVRGWFTQLSQMLLPTP